MLNHSTLEYHVTKFSRSDGSDGRIKTLTFKFDSNLNEKFDLVPNVAISRDKIAAFCIYYLSGLYARYPIVARALGLGRVRARAKVSCIQHVTLRHVCTW